MQQIFIQICVYANIHTRISLFARKQRHGTCLVSSVTNTYARTWLDIRHTYGNEIFASYCPVNLLKSFSLPDSVYEFVCRLCMYMYWIPCNSFIR